MTSAAGKTVLITGANAGIGKEAARQLALRDEVGRMYLACRNPGRAQAPKAELEAATGRSIFDIVVMDVSDPESVRAALLATGRLTEVALYAGSEAAGGIPKFRMQRPAFATTSADELATVIDGSYFKGRKPNPALAYGQAKYIAALWMASMARQHPKQRFITMSPGNTSGTGSLRDQPLPLRLAAKYVMPALGSPTASRPVPNDSSTASPTPPSEAACSTPAPPTPSPDRSPTRPTSSPTSGTPRSRTTPTRPSTAS